MFKSLSLAAIAAVAAAKGPSFDELVAIDYQYTFDQYQADFEKEYETDKIRAMREVEFSKNLQKIQLHNKANGSWFMGVNEYADMSASEFKATKMGKVTSGEGSPTPWAECPSAMNATKPSTWPESVDWRTKGVVTPAKNQGGCGSCWTFSTAETLESHIAINTGKLMTFSEQEFVDCVENPNDCGGTGGCNGATQWLGFQYAVDNGVTLETSYPYVPATGKCDKSKVVPAAHIKSYCRLPHASDSYTATQQYDDLMNAIVHYGPVAISAAAEPWQLYSHGVFDSNCGTDVDHAIQLVGYGTDTGILGDKDYWLVRNSWGGDWGEKGYIRIRRDGSKGGEKCGTDKTPGDGTACKTDPKTMEVCGLCGIMSDSSYPIGGTLA